MAAASSDALLSAFCMEGKARAQKASVAGRSTWTGTTELASSTNHSLKKARASEASGWPSMRERRRSRSAEETTGGKGRYPYLSARRATNLRE